MGEPWGGPEICPECDESSIDLAEKDICNCGYCKNPEQIIERMNELMKKNYKLIQDNNFQNDEWIKLNQQVGAIETDRDHWKNKYEELLAKSS